MQFQESTWTPDGVHQDAWLSVTTSVQWPIGRRNAYFGKLASQMFNANPYPIFILSSERFRMCSHRIAALQYQSSCTHMPFRRHILPCVHLRRHWVDFSRNHCRSFGPMCGTVWCPYLRPRKISAFEAIIVEE